MIRGKRWSDGWLTVFWGREERGCPKDLIFAFPARPDGRLMYSLFTRTIPNIAEGGLIKELEDRGYDLSTLQFSIKRKWKSNEKPEPVSSPEAGAPK